VSRLTSLIEGANIGVAALFIALKGRSQHSFIWVQQRLLYWTRPMSRSLLTGTLTDLARTKAEFVAENGLLRQQLIMLRRQGKRPTCTMTDRLLLLLLTRARRRPPHPSCRKGTAALPPTGQITASRREAAPGRETR
jgi:hypothetical protein